MATNYDWFIMDVSWSGQLDIMLESWDIIY